MEANHLRPPDAADAAEFVAAMRELRVRSGYSFRQLERRAEHLGEVLPSSTLSSALGRSTLPREQIVTAFVRACGGSEETAAAWAEVRADLAAAAVLDDPRVSGDEPAAGDSKAGGGADLSGADVPDVDGAGADVELVTDVEPVSESAVVADGPADVAAEAAPSGGAAPVESRRRGYRLLVVAAVVVLVLVVVAVFLNIPREERSNAATDPTTTTTVAATTAVSSTVAETTTGSAPIVPAQNPVTAVPPPPTTTTTTTRQQEPQPPSPGAPGDGIQRIRLAHTGLCVGEGPEKFTSETRIVLGQQDCATASPPTALERLADGTYRIKLHHPQYGVGCATVDYGGNDPGTLLAGDNCGERPEQRFTLEPVATGYRLRSVPGAAYCVGVYRGSRDVGVQLIQDRCDDGAYQVFTLG